jgi:hypothetical protein
VKKIPYNKEDKKQIEVVHKEIFNLSILKHENILSYYNMFMEDGCFHLVTELCEVCFNCEERALYPIYVYFFFFYIV